MCTVNTFAARIFGKRNTEQIKSVLRKVLIPESRKKSGIRLQGIGEKPQHAFPCTNRRTFLHRNRPMCGSKRKAAENGALRSF